MHIYKYFSICNEMGKKKIVMQNANHYNEVNEIFVFNYICFCCLN